MGRLEFYAWVHQANRNLSENQPSPHTWRDTDKDSWWEQAREKRRKRQGR